MKRFLTALFLTLAAAAAAQAQSFVQTKDWDVYVDLPTRFAYVKTPTGWKFVRQLDEAQMAKLHPTTLTALLPREQQDIQYAHPALELSPRMMALRASGTRVAAQPGTIRAE
ncbi:hypothetical protein [Variovorax sp. YR752]|uniref:hypothetical protein n=1 Tax=Variovorax sp. YR752 TaxID=1884383 RepID=UPI0031382C70